MRKLFKVIIVIVVVLVGIVIVGAIGSMPYVNTNPDEIAGISSFVVIEEGSITKLRFSLIDNDGYAAASDANLKLRISGQEQEFSVSASEFKQYKLQLTGQPIYAYAWQINNRIPEGTAVLTVTLPNGKEFTASERVF